MPQQPSSRDITHQASKAPQKDEREHRIEWLASRNQYIVFAAGLLLVAMFVLLRSGYAIPILAVTTITGISLLVLLLQWLRLTRMKAPDERARQLMLRSFRWALGLLVFGFCAFYTYGYLARVHGLFGDSSESPRQWLVAMFLGQAVYHGTLLVKNGSSGQDRQSYHFVLFWISVLPASLLCLMEITGNLVTAIVDGASKLALLLLSSSWIFLTAAAYLAFIVTRHDRRTAKELSDE